MGGRASAASKNKYNSKVYDRINLVVPKGRKAELQILSAQLGESLNGFITKAIEHRIDNGGLQNE